MFLIHIFIAIFFCIILLCFFRKVTVWWEYLIQLLIPIIIVIITQSGMLKSNTTSTEFLGYYITGIKHYDTWNEYIHKICTERYPCGIDSKGNTTYCTRVYDCSYVKTHPEYWVMIDNINREHNITKNTFNKYVNLWKTPMIFINMHRNYYIINGDAQLYKWNNEPIDAISITLSHKYKNKIKASYSLFNLRKITDKEADTIGLFKYPEITSFDKYAKTNQDIILGIDIDEKLHNRFKYLNGYYGNRQEFRFYILIFKNQNPDIFWEQRNYWANGNMNELILCYSIDDNNKIQWFNAFSWCDRPNIESSLRQHYSSNDSLDFDFLYNHIETQLINNKWNRKDFADFDYIKPELTNKQFTWLLCIGIFMNIVLGCFSILNGFHNKKIIITNE